MVGPHSDEADVAVAVGWVLLEVGCCQAGAVAWLVAGCRVAGGWVVTAANVVPRVG